MRPVRQETMQPADHLSVSTLHCLFVSFNQVKDYHQGTGVSALNPAWQMLTFGTMGTGVTGGFGTMGAGVTGAGVGEGITCSKPHGRDSEQLPVSAATNS